MNAPNQDLASLSSKSARYAKLLRILGLLTALGCALLLYLPSLRYPFLSLDDPLYITQRAPLHKIAQGKTSGWTDLLGIETIRGRKMWEYFPVRDLSYGLDAWRGGIRPYSFRQTALFLFLGILVFLWALLGRLGVPLLAQGLATLSLSLHPLMVEPNIWMSSRKDLLMGFFSIAAMMFAALSFPPQTPSPLSIEKIDRNIPVRRWAWWLCLLCLCGAAGSKGPGVFSYLFVLLFLGYQGGFRALRSRIFGLVLTGLLLCAWFGFTLWYGQAMEVLSAEKPLVLRAFHAFGMPVWAFFRWLVPAGLSVDYANVFVFDVWWQDPFPWCMLLYCAWLMLRELKGQSRGPLWMTLAWCLSIAPYSGLIEAGQHHADRFMLFNNVLGAICVGLLLTQWKRLSPVILALMCFWFWQAKQYIPKWKTELTFWTYNYRQNPKSPFIIQGFARQVFYMRKYDVVERLAISCIKQNKASFSCHQILHAVYLQALLKTPKTSPQFHVVLRKAKKALQRTKRIFKLRSAQKKKLIFSEAVIAHLHGDNQTAEIKLRSTLDSFGINGNELRLLLKILLQQDRRSEAQSLLREHAFRFLSDSWIQSRWQKLKRGEDPFPKTPKRSTSRPLSLPASSPR